MTNEQPNSLNLQLAQVRKRAIAKLVSLTGAPADDCRETYLFEKDHFCGVRWTVRDSEAIWRTGSDQIVCYRDGQPIQDTAPIRRAA